MKRVGHCCNIAATTGGLEKVHNLHPTRYTAIYDVTRWWPIKNSNRHRSNLHELKKSSWIFDRSEAQHFTPIEFHFGIFKVKQGRKPRCFSSFIHSFVCTRNCRVVLSISGSFSLSQSVGFLTSERKASTTLPQSLGLAHRLTTLLKVRDRDFEKEIEVCWAVAMPFAIDVGTQRAGS